MAAKKTDVQIGEELEQLAAAAEKQPAEEAGLLGIDGRQGEAQVLVRDYPPIVRKQADRLLRLFELPEGHPGRNERIKEYQDALVRNGVDEPPLTLLDVQLFVEEVGKQHG